MLLTLTTLPLIRRVFLRSEEHTFELQSQSNLVCRLLLEKKKKTPPCRSAHTIYFRYSTLASRSQARYTYGSPHTSGCSIIVAPSSTSLTLTRSPLSLTT